MDKFLVIASDGLWGMMRVEEVVKFVHNFNKDDHLKGGDVSHRLESCSTRFVAFEKRLSPVLSCLLQPEALSSESLAVS